MKPLIEFHWNGRHMIGRSEEAHQCPVCRSMHYLWIVKDGKGCCAACGVGSTKEVLYAA